MYFKTFNSKNIEIIYIKINIIFYMATTSFGNVGLQFLNNKFYYFSNEFSRKLLILNLILIEREENSKIFGRLKIFTFLNFQK